MHLTNFQLSQLRQRPHRTRLWLSIFRPRVVLEAQINQSDIAKSDRDITISILSGVMLDVEADMTVYVGSSQGAKDIGRLRVRSGSGTTLTLAENAVNWENGWYLTVVRFFEPWGVYPRIELDDNNIPLWYKDYDIAYTDQNEEWRPVVCMGPDDAGFLNLGNIAPTGSFDVWYTSSGSFNPTFGASPITGSVFDWHFEGGTPTGSSAVDPGWVTYTGVGNFITSLTITTDQSKAFTGRRHIRVMARPENEGSEKSTSAWGLGGLSGERDSGGWSGDIWIREPADVEDITDGALVVIFSEDYEGGTEVTKIGANAENRGHVFFVGYILNETISYDPETNRVDFSVGGTSASMAQLATLNVAVDDHKPNEITGQETHPWSRMPYTTVDRGFIHFLQWHSTVLAVKDISLTVDGESRALKGVDIARGNLWDSGNQYLNATVGAQLVSDRQGKLWCEVNANWQPTGSSRQVWGHMQPVIEITRQDWRQEVDIERGGDGNAMAYLELSGVAWSGASTGTFEAYLSGAPGFAPAYHGTATRQGNLALDGLEQDGLNQLAGNAYADANARYQRVGVPLAGDYRFLDIAPQHRVLMTLESDDTWRRIAWDQKPFIPVGMTYEYLAEDQMLLMDMDLYEETFGGPGETIEIPVEPPYTGGVLPEWEIEFPPITPPPPEPPIPPPELPENLYAYSVYLHANNTSYALYQTRGLENDPPEWNEIMNAGHDPTGTVTGNIGGFLLDLFEPTTRAYMLTADAVWVCQNLNATGSFNEITWVSTLTLDEMRTLTGHASAFFRGSSEPFIGAMAVSLAKPEFLAVLAFQFVAGSTYEIFYLWTEDVLSGAASWNVSQIDDGSGEPFFGNGPSTINVSWHDHNVVYVSAGHGGGAGQLTNLFWTSDPTLGWLTRNINQSPFENIQHHNVLIPRLRNPEDTYVVAFNRRTQSHPWYSDTLGHQWDNLGSQGDTIDYGENITNNLAEPMNADTPQWHIIGNENNPPTYSGIQRWNEAIQEWDVLVTTDPSPTLNSLGEVINLNPAWVPNDSFFRGGGYWIWPFNQDVQLVTNGAGWAGAAGHSQLWFTLDGWASARNVTGVSPTAIGEGHDGRLTRWTQVCWQIVLEPGA